ncbi:MFS general substrate transporter [Tilletiopsis washingtonensis]|uniref:MFS general substrate transporter n=1 Tax=Tilletiopsis washingtonensis TaxID=58919 RepID=A0A316Z6P0_9BASI|nr:MFS general substrate transporter [Tilletiopsis washingtonensis]PWN97269.1 MFS general substrate transporter [Tilletiopsis washingtonensis]
MQPRPAALKSLPQELLFVGVCGMGQALFGWLLGNVVVNQRSLTADLGTSNSQKPWLLGSFLLTNGLSVVISGSLADHLGPKMLMVGGFAWLSLWNLITGFSLSSKYLFFISRAMQGFACGALTSSSISLLGQTYSPGRRKSRAFSGMAAMAPVGYWLGAIHGGLLTEHRPWIFFSMAIGIALLFVLSLSVVPASVDPRATAARPSLRQFDYLGALLAMIGLGCIVAGLTQGSPAGWQPYTYILIIAGAATLAAFTLAERQATRPLVPMQLFSVPNFPAVILVYFLAFGAFSVWQFYMLEFFLSVQKVAPLTAALYLTPNAIVGLLCTFGTASLLHVVPGHYVLCVSALASGAGAVFFLPQTANTSYYALSMPGIALATLCPDLSFAAVAVLLTTSVPRTYQGSAGAFLMTAQSLSAAIFIGIGDAIATATPGQVAHADLEMRSLRSVWWFSLAVALVSAAIGLAFVRIPKTQEREHYD